MAFISLALSMIVPTRQLDMMSGSAKTRLYVLVSALEPEQLSQQAQL
jgi:hypothetical protein